MFIDLIDINRDPERVAWGTNTVYADGSYYAMFNTKSCKSENGYGIDIFRSQDGVHWKQMYQDELIIIGAHAGYGFHRLLRWKWFIR